MRKYSQAPPLPGTGNPRNLVPSKVPGFHACPCCGAIWKGGKPWSETIMTVLEVAAAAGLSSQTITQRIRNGTIAAYPQSGRNGYLIPVFEFERVMKQDPLDGGARPEKASKVQDLGSSHG